jgi:hypothetical protein
LIISKGSNINAIADAKNGDTLLNVCARKNYENSAVFLVDKNAEINTLNNFVCLLNISVFFTSTYKRGIKFGYSVRLSVRKILTIYLSCHIDGWINDLDFYVIPMLYHRDSSDFFAKP